MYHHATIIIKVYHFVNTNFILIFRERGIPCHHKSRKF
nr:MAG TPA: hypothetical protein [Inoviridae sp.]